MVSRAGRRSGWWRIGLGITWSGVAGWLLATRAGVLLAGHPAQAVSLAVVAPVGAVLLLLGVRDLRRARHAPPTREQRGHRTWVVVLGRALALVLSVLVLASLVYLRPFSASPGAIRAMTGSPDVEASREDLPADASFVVITGAAHAFFGDYGVQPGDGTPTTSRADAQQRIVRASADLLASVASG